MNQMNIKDGMIKNLEEIIKRKNEENAKKSDIIKNYESRYH